MAMNLRLTDEEAEALRARAALEGTSMNDLARRAIADYVNDRPARFRAAIEKVAAEDAELIERLGR